MIVKQPLLLREYNLLDDFSLNIKVNHETLTGNTFTHQFEVAQDARWLESIDANRGDCKNVWNADSF